MENNTIDLTYRIRTMVIINTFCDGKISVFCKRIGVSIRDFQQYITDETSDEKSSKRSKVLFAMLTTFRYEKDGVVFAIDANAFFRDFENVMIAV